MQQLAPLGFQVILFKDAFVKASSDLTYLQSAALDFDMCRRATVFVGTTMSSFSSSLFQLRAATNSSSYVYNRQDLQLV